MYFDMLFDINSVKRLNFYSSRILPNYTGCYQLKYYIVIFILYLNLIEMKYTRLTQFIVYCWPLLIFSQPGKYYWMAINERIIFLISVILLTLTLFVAHFYCFLNSQSMAKLITVNNDLDFLFNYLLWNVCLVIRNVMS